MFSILEIHELFFNFLIQWKLTHKEFTFWARKNEKSNPDKNRLLKGYWFQGTDNYLFLGLSNQSGGQNMTRSIGFVVAVKKDCYETNLEIVWQGETDSEKLKFYNNLVKQIKNIQRVTDYKYIKKYNKLFTREQLINDLQNFLENDFKILETEMQANPKLDMLVPEDKFNALITKINKVRNELTKDQIISKEIETNNINTMKNSLNQILFGPPGTGKTYNTINLAVKTAYPDIFIHFEELSTDSQEEKEQKRKNLTQFFRENLYNHKNNSAGRIAFTTFHQSMAYEDFIEGIKPVDPVISKKNFLEYKVEDGIFKNFCKSARDYKILKNTLFTETEFINARFVKLNFTTENSEAAKKCISNNYITFYPEITFDLSNEKEILKKYNDDKNDIHELISPINSSKQLIFVITLNEDLCLGVGRVTGEYEFQPDTLYKHSRKIEWFKKNPFSTSEILKASDASKGTIVFFSSDKIKKDFFFEKDNIENIQSNEKPNYVFIIDEINRGNIAQIFGELITLIEDSKREGEKEEIKAILPYSKESFSVPSNLHIIGTMNTADRSVEALDSALRRRFSFIEMMPDSEVIEPKEVEGILLQQLLQSINDRLEVLLSKEHTIGHTYLIGIKNIEGLKHAFNNKIIPLLKEYFYGDFGKISMVIGNDFVNNIALKGNKSLFMIGYTEMIDEYAEIKPWVFANIEKMKDDDFKSAVKKIYS